MAFILLSGLTSCSVENVDSDTFYLEVLAIDSVDIPEYFLLGETSDISITYTKPNLCYQFNDFIYEIVDNERSVAIVNTVYPNANCEQTQERVTVSFNFTVSGTKPCMFKFYQGEDSEGVDQYYFVEVPVKVPE
ncbi:hypothetical protein [Winogradskyella sp. PG-2]|uniref:hypothetical protein n=1 Tax=Winogradskyella sp. PG-2 TaxID=754409 RepID=UPI00045866A1|nr:hypothetical protein [Winogradskyella sp. PG-2]BAO75628.1 hypothetical protein WPG_1398 [Winogradskyella sp. PG-2]